MSSLTEIELKLQVPEHAREAVQAAVSTTTAQRTHLQAIYFDTADRRLARAGMSLRLRKEGRQWVQTTKAGGLHAMQRMEHEVVLRGVAGNAPAIDLQRHVGTPLGDLLTETLAPQSGELAAVLLPLYRTDIWRSHRVLRAKGGSVELAFDLGEIVAEDRRWPICELEIELVRGSPAAVIDVAQRWAVRHGLWLDVRSKAERGDRLARGEILGPAYRASRVRLEPQVSAEAAFRVVLGNCLDQLLPNASEVAGGNYSVEHVHQLRVSVRRMRAAVRFFQGWVPAIDPAWLSPLANLFRLLGQARDRDALTASLLPELREAGAPLPELPRTEKVPDPVESTRAEQVTQALLALQGFLAGVPILSPSAQSAVQDASAPEVQAEEGSTLPAQVLGLAELAAKRLNRWHRQIVREAGRYASLDDEARHTLRKRAKRLRYAVEFVASLYSRKAVRRYLDLLGPVQETLGRYNDLTVACALYREASATDARAWFAVGWLTSQREQVLAEGAAALKRFTRAERFWKD